jgi:DNA-binding GntR family transcriptional regulator
MGAQYQIRLDGAACQVRQPEKPLQKNHEEHVAIFRVVQARGASLAERLMAGHKRRVADNTLNPIL